MNEHPGLRVIVGRRHDLLPQIARLDRAVHPQAVAALARRRRRASRGPGAALCTSSQSPSVSTARMKASVTATLTLKLRRSPWSLAWMNSSMSGWSQRRIPICAPRRAPADSTVSQLWSNTRMYDTGPLALLLVPAHQRALGPDRREVVADAAAAAHGLRGLHQRDVDAGLAVDGLGHRIADRLHEAIDQRRLSCVPAAELTRPPGMNPLSSAS